MRTMMLGTHFGVDDDLPTLKSVDEVRDYIFRAIGAAFHIDLQE